MQARVLAQGARLGIDAIRDQVTIIGGSEKEKRFSRGGCRQAEERDQKDIRF
ncbi:MAG: hypothetical protein ACI97B_003330 [Verrucomicrobiales bacterium]